MSFLALMSQKSVLNLQKNFLALQQLSISNQRQVASAGMAAVQKAIDAEWAGLDQTQKPDYTDDATYIYYEQLDEQLETEKDMIDSQMTAIENELSSLKTLVNNSIKSSCTLNLLGGN